MTDAKSPWKTTREAAEAMGRDEKTILHYLEEGTLIGKRVSPTGRWYDIEPASSRTAPVAPPELSERDKLLSQLKLDKEFADAETAATEAKNRQALAAIAWTPAKLGEEIKKFNAAVADWQKNMNAAEAALNVERAKAEEERALFAKYQAEAEADWIVKKDSQESALKESESVLEQREENLQEQEKMLSNSLSELAQDIKGLTAGEATLERKKSALVNQVRKTKSDYGKYWENLISYLRGSCGWTPGQRHRIIEFLNPISLALFGKEYVFDNHSAHIVEKNSVGEETRQFEVNEQDDERYCPLAGSTNGKGVSVDAWLQHQVKNRKAQQAAGQLAESQQEEEELTRDRLDYLWEKCPKLCKFFDSKLPEATEGELLEAIISELMDVWMDFHPQEYKQAYQEDKFMDDIFSELVDGYPEYAEKVYSEAEKKGVA